MVRELEQILRPKEFLNGSSARSQNDASTADPFPEKAPTANPVFYRTYSRRFDGRRESLEDVIQRTTKGLAKLGQMTRDEVALLERMQRQLKSLPSGRWMWVGGTEWIEKPDNFSGAYNCLLHQPFADRP